MPNTRDDLLSAVDQFLESYCKLVMPNPVENDWDVRYRGDLFNLQAQVNDLYRQRKIVDELCVNNDLHSRFNYTIAHAAYEFCQSLCDEKQQQYKDAVVQWLADKLC